MATIRSLAATATAASVATARLRRLLRPALLFALRLLGPRSPSITAGTTRSGIGGGRSDERTPIYKSYLDLDIRRKGDKQSLFEGHAKARSTTDDLGRLVPNLVEAMFTGFPGRNGETVKITVPPPDARQRRHGLTES